MLIIIIYIYFYLDINDILSHTFLKIFTNFLKHINNINLIKKFKKKEIVEISIYLFLLYY